MDKNPSWAQTDDRLSHDDGAEVHAYELPRGTSFGVGRGTEPSWSPDGASLAVRMDWEHVDLLNVQTRARRILIEAQAPSQCRAGQVTSVRDPLQHTTAFGYTGGDLTSVTDPVNAIQRRFLDAGGRVIAVTDPLGRQTHLVPDKLNRVTTATDVLGAQTAFSYDPNSNLQSLTDAALHPTSYTYDTNDRVATRTDPLQQVTHFEYDKNDNLLKTTERNGQVTMYEYDSLDRRTLVTYADTSTTAFIYDAGDRITQINDSVSGVTSTITREYDLLDRLKSETTPEGTVSYTYDADGRRSTMTVSGQPQVTYGYDDAHRLGSIAQGTNVVGLAYDDGNRRSTVTFPNGIVATYAYDNANHLTSLAYTRNGAPIGDLTYTYDLAGQRTGVGGSFARTGLPQALATATYDAGNRLTAWGSTALSYDVNGNLASDGLTSYSWNARNRLVALSGGPSASFAYDALGRRRGKTIGGTTTNFLYDGINLVQERTGNTPTANLLTGSVDEIFTRTDGAGTSIFLTDGLGSALELTDAAGALQTHYAYDPFGTTTVSGATSTNTQQFTDRENDGTGLYEYRARFYSPGMQRFLSEDPLEFGAGDVNLYAYVGNQPTMWRDPSGLVKLFLPPGHPCRWPPDDAPKTKSDDPPPPEPPLSWWLKCSPFVVPDLLPIPATRPDGTGMPRVKGPFIDLKPHPFPIIGPQPHIQINIWFDGIPGIQIPIRIPLPGWPWW